MFVTEQRANARNIRGSGAKTRGFSFVNPMSLYFSLFEKSIGVRPNALGATSANLSGTQLANVSDLERDMIIN
jgi:hypothetical protein